MTQKLLAARKSRLSRKHLRAQLEEADPALMEAVVAGCTLVAYCDGWVTADEERRMRGLIRGFAPVRAFAMDDVLGFFHELTARFERDVDEAEAHALNLVVRLAGRPKEAELLIETCCSIAESDGGFDAAERQAILRMCDLLEVDPADHGL